MNYNAKVLGIRYLNFLDNDGKPVKGHQVWVSAHTNVTGWRDGEEVLKIWVPDGSDAEVLMPTLHVGDMVMICFNRRGKPQLC